MDALRTRVRAYRTAHDTSIVRELRDFVAIPNVASDTANIRRNAERLRTMMESRGIAAKILDSPTGGSPAVYGELSTPGATRTVVFYAHYDGQPVDPAQWTSPPWSPVLLDKPLEAGGKPVATPAAAGAMQGEWRLYGRSSSDDKAPIVAMLTAIDALKSAGVRPSVNLKLFFEGEEEAGSGHLESILEKNAALLRADAWLFGDGPVHQSRRQQVVFGVRGVTGAEITLYGPSHALHSGHYGNWAPNPVTMLANLIASMRNDDGRILICALLRRRRADHAGRASRAGQHSVRRLGDARRDVARRDGSDERRACRANHAAGAQPARAFSGGAVGATAANAIPTEATASIDFRLVPRQTPDHVRRLVETHIRERGYTIVQHTPTPEERMRHPRIAKITWEAGYAPTRVAMDSPLSQAVLRATSEAVGGPVVALPTLGGSLPMYTFEKVLHAPLIVLPIVNHDNNQHAANENVRLQNVFDGIDVYAGVLARLGTYWDRDRIRP